MTITEKDLQEWQAQCDEADPPPWDCAHGYEYSRRHPPQVGLPTANTRFANTARTAVPRLIEEVMRLRDLGRTCECGEDQLCVFAHERDEARARAERLQGWVDTHQSHDHSEPGVCRICNGEDPDWMAELRDLRSYIVKLRGKTDPKDWRGIDAVTARAVMAEARAERAEAEVFGLRVDVAAWRETSSRHQKNAKRAEEALQSELDNPTYHICTRANEATKQALMVSGRGILPPDDCPRCHWLERACKALQQQTTEEEK